MHRVLACIAAVILVPVIINARSPSHESLPATNARGSGHGSLKGKLDDLYITKAKWVRSACGNDFEYYEHHDFR